MSKESFLCFIFQELTKKSPTWGTMPITGVNDLTRDLFRSLEVFLPNCSIFSFFKKSNYIDHGVWNPEVGPREDLRGKSTRFSPLETPSVMCPRLAAGYANIQINFRDCGSFLTVGNPISGKDESGER
ncbi:MAG: hypothetical protein O7B35_06140 [Deltaproteobacteria bacterium]|nr:hypothetical protein [Deltaproteobacteria bacterium]